MASLTLRDGRIIDMPDGLTPQQVEAIAAAASEPPAPVQDETNAEHAASPARTAGLAARAVGRGVGADMLGVFGDAREANDYFGTKAVNLASDAVNSGISPVFEELLSLTGVNADIPDIPELPEGAISDLMKYLPLFSSPTSDQIAGATEEVGKSLGVNLPEPETGGEKLFSNIVRYGSGAATGGAGLAKSAEGIAARELPALLRLYAKNAGRTIAGDAAGGAGMGAALAGADEYMPETASNPLARLMVSLAGGLAGSALTSLVTSPVKALDKVKGWFPDIDPVLRDPETGNSPRIRNADQAAQYLQKGASDSKAASEAIANNQSYFDDVGGAMPTSGLMSDDLGLQMLEKSQRIADPKPFLERDKAVRTSAARDLETVRPADGDPNVPREVARDTINAKRSLASDAERTAQSQLHGADVSERELMQGYQPYAGGGSVASEDLDKVLVGETMKPMQKTKNDLFAAVDPEGGIMRSTDPLVRLAAALRGETEGLPPSVQREVLPETLLKDLEATSPTEGGSGEMSFRDLNDTRAVISSMEQQARAAGQSPLADTLQRFKDTISQDAKALAADGSEAGNRAMAADSYYRDTFAPLFSEGEGGKLRKDINRDDLARSNTPPTETGRRFLREGPGGKEAAVSLQRIIAAAPNAKAGADAARRYVLDDLARTVGADGKVSETALRKWINARTGMLSQIPAIDKEVRGLLDEVSKRSTKTGAMKMELEKAQIGRKRTEKEIDQSALSLLIDADPRHAAARVMSSSDPVAAANELQATFAGNKAAERGWRAAVSDHLIESLGTGGKAGIADDIDAVSLDKLATSFRKNEAALKVVFGDDMKYLQQARRRLELLSNKAVQAARGGGEIPRAGIVHGAKKTLDVILRLVHGALRGGSEMKKYNLLAEGLPDTTKAANDLVKRALFDPNVAQHLLARPVAEVGTPAWNKKLNRLMGWAEAGRASGRDQGQ